jgi:hypothetical protein
LKSKIENKNEYKRYKEYKEYKNKADVKTDISRIVKKIENSGNLFINRSNSN